MRKKIENLAAVSLLCASILACTSPDEKSADFIISADSYFQQNELVKAEIEYKNALQINQNLPEAWFGLAQIYQLRGRVGRSSEQAYAYLLIPGEHLVTRQAQRRLLALMDFTELGSGFKIALNDLQIRGAGNILGASQSGHIAAVGYEMYVRLMEKAIAELKGEDVREQVEPEIQLNLAAHLPAAYISNDNQRLAIYKRLASASDESGLADMEEELRDRYGPLPPEATQLFALLSLKLVLRRLWIRRLDALNGEFIITFAENPEIDVDKLALLVSAESERLRLSPDNRLYFKSPDSELTESIDELKKLLHNLELRVTNKNL